MSRKVNASYTADQVKSAFKVRGNKHSAHSPSSVTHKLPSLANLLKELPLATYTMLNPSACQPHHVSIRLYLKACDTLQLPLTAPFFLYTREADESVQHMNEENYCSSPRYTLGRLSLQWVEMVVNQKSLYALIQFRPTIHLWRPHIVN